MIKRLRLLSVLSLTLALLMSGCGKQQGKLNTETENPIDTESLVSTADTASMDFELTDRDRDGAYQSVTGNVTLSENDADISGDGVTKKDGNIIITDEGTYKITGAVTDSMLVVEADDTDKIQIFLNNATLKNSAGPAILIKSADKVFLTLADGSTNVVEDGGNYALTVDDSTVDAAIFSKEDFTINGGGTLTVTGNLKHGIVSKDDLVISNSTLNVTAKNVAINGKDCVKISEATVNVTAGTDGIRSDNDEDTSRGFVYLDNSKIDITAGNDGIQAQTVLKAENTALTASTGGGSSNASTKSDGSFNDGWGFHRGSQTTDTSTDEESGKGLKAGSDILVTGGSFVIDSADDSLHSNGTIKITSGQFDLTSGDDGIHADTSLAVEDGEIKINKSYEGLESSNVVISGGDISVTATDDGINAAGGNDSSAMGGRPGQNSFSRSTGAIAITGGKIYINMSGDGIDANGTLSITGGEIVVSGATQGDTAILDFDSSGTISGGTFIGTGASGMAQNFSSDSAQGVIMFTSTTQLSGTEITLTDSKGNTVMSYTSDRNFSCIIISHPDIVEGEAYTLTVGSESNEIEMSTTVYGSGSGMGGYGGGMPGGGHGGGMGGFR